MRPSAIVNFERLFLASSALGLAVLVLQGGAGMGVDPTWVIAAGVVAVGITVALAFWASRGRSNLARWLLAAVAVYGLLTTGLGIGRALGAGDGFELGDLLNVAAVLLQGAAVAMLFTKPARDWFAGTDVAA